MLHTDQQTKWH